MKSMYDVIKRPIITEKTNGLVEKLQYTFEVDPSANKTEIKDAIEKIFKVNVVEIRTVNVHRKAKRMQRFEGFKPAYKKAIAIYRMLERQVEVWESEKREISYLPYPASWLNDNVENSPHFKKGRKR